MTITPQQVARAKAITKAVFPKADYNSGWRSIESHAGSSTSRILAIGDHDQDTLWLMAASYVATGQDLTNAPGYTLGPLYDGKPLRGSFNPSSALMVQV